MESRYSPKDDQLFLEGTYGEETTIHTGYIPSISSPDAPLQLKPILFEEWPDLPSAEDLFSPIQLTLDSSGPPNQWTQQIIFPPSERQ